LSQKKKKTAQASVVGRKDGRFVTACPVGEKGSDHRTLKGPVGGTVEEHLVDLETTQDYRGRKMGRGERRVRGNKSPFFCGNALGLRRADFCWKKLSRA